MNRLTLYRRWDDGDRCIGELYVDGRPFCFTLEPGSFDTSAPHVDPGFYFMERHDSDRYGMTWALIGDDVSHFEESGISRSAILFHGGNWDEETRGCILVGNSIEHQRSEAAVWESRAAMERLRQLIGDAPALLSIKEG